MRKLLIATHPATVLAAGLGLFLFALVVALCILAVALAAYLGFLFLLVESARQEFRKRMPAPDSSEEQEPELPLLDEPKEWAVVLDENGRAEVWPTWPTPEEIADYEREPKTRRVPVGPQENDGWVYTSDELPLPEEVKPRVMPGADRVVASRPTAVERLAKIERAKQLLAEGRSRRAAAKEIGVAESTLRAWLK